MAESKENPVIFVVYGKNHRAVIEHIEKITERVLGQSDRQVSLTSFEGDSAVLADVLDELRTLPFLSERRLIIVRDADVFIRTYRENLETYLENPSPTGVLLLVPESFPGNTRLAKKAKKIGQVISCEPVKAQNLPRYLAEYAKQTHGVTLAPDAAALLVELGGDDSGMLCSEVDKLAAYVADPEHDRKRIEAADVQTLVGNNRQFNVFNVIDVMTQGQAGLALKLLEQMLSQDRDAQYKAVGAFAWHFRRLYNGRLMLDQNVPERQVIQQLRIWSQPDAFLRQLKQLNLRTIGDCLQSLMHIDLVSKTGGGTVRTGLEKLIIEFCRGQMATA
jgi:DNA polymerase III subunit delta